MAYRRLLGVCLVLTCPALAAAQTPPQVCISANIDVIQSGQNFTISWTMQQLVPASPTDPTLVQHRYNGFFEQIDLAAPVAVPLTTEIGVCPQGTPRQGDKIYQYRTTSGVAKGNHILKVWAWNYALNADGSPTSVVQEGTVITTNFDAADQATPILVGAPYGPWNVSIKK